MPATHARSLWPHCCRPVKGTVKHVGKRVKCPGCGEPFVFQHADPNTDRPLALEKLQGDVQHAKRSANPPFARESQQDVSVSTERICTYCQQPLSGIYCKACKKFTFEKTLWKWAVPCVVIPALVIFGNTQLRRLLIETIFPGIHGRDSAPTGSSLTPWLMYGIAVMSAVSWGWIYFGLPALRKRFPGDSKTSVQQQTIPARSTGPSISRGKRGGSSG